MRSKDTSKVCCNMLQYAAVCCSLLQFVAGLTWLARISTRFVAVLCSLLRCVACVAVWGSVLQCVAVCCRPDMGGKDKDKIQHTATYLHQTSKLLQHTATHCNTLQHEDTKQACVPSHTRYVYPHTCALIHHTCAHIHERVMSPT